MLPFSLSYVFNLQDPVSLMFRESKRVVTIFNRRLAAGLLDRLSRTRAPGCLVITVQRDIINSYGYKRRTTKLLL